jgi:hypothetical protein
VDLLIGRLEAGKVTSLWMMRGCSEVRPFWDGRFVWWLAAARPRRASRDGVRAAGLALEPGWGGEAFGRRG